MSNLAMAAYFRRIGDALAGKQPPPLVIGSPTTVRVASEMMARVVLLREALAAMLIMLPSDPGVCEASDDDAIPPAFVYLRWKELRDARAALDRTELASPWWPEPATEAMARILHQWPGGAPNEAWSALSNVMAEIAGLRATSERQQTTKGNAP